MDDETRAAFAAQGDTMSAALATLDDRLRAAIAAQGDSARFVLVVRGGGDPAVLPGALLPVLRP